MSVLRIRCRAFPLAVVAVALLSACSRQNPVAPITADDSYVLSRSLEAGPLGQGAFFPLAIGNRWHVVADDHIVTIPSDGGPTSVELAIHTDITREMTGTETISGLVYTLLREQHISTSPANPGGSSYTTWVRYRQDADGLYESDVTGPPVTAAAVPTETTRPDASFSRSLRARVPVAQVAAYEKAWERLQRKIAAVQSVAANPPRATDVAPGEITRLEYPLHPGTAWTIRESPNFTSAVERLERLDLPAGRFNAYRIRINGEFFGPEDTVHLWMSRSGQLRFHYRLVEPAIDVDGNLIGETIAEHNEIVDAISLVRP